MTTKNTLREEICKIFGVSPEELEYNLPGGIGLEKCQQLEVLISDVVAKAEREAVDNVLDELLEWYEVKSQMSAQPFNWYGAVKALKISKDHKKPFNVLKPQQEEGE